MTKQSSNCLICGKPTYEKPSKNGDVLCSQQCIFIFSNRNSIKVKYEAVANEILELKKDMASLLKIVNVNLFKGK